MGDSTKSAIATQGLTLRALFLVGFIIAMPMLALPAIAKLADRLIYGKVESSIPPLPPADNPKFEVSPPALRLSSTERVKATPPSNAPRQPAREVSPVSFPAPLSGSGRSSEGLPAGSSFLNDVTLQRLEKIRVELERLGADEIRLEQFDQPTTTFAFFCRMLVVENSVETKPFAAVEAQPLLAAEKVLKEVRAWRLAITLAPAPESAPPPPRRSRYAPQP